MGRGTERSGSRAGPPRRVEGNQLRHDPHGPWGILTSVRPAKLIHNLLDRGLTRRIRELLLTVGVSPERGNLYKGRQLARRIPLA